MTALFIRHQAQPGKREEVRRVWEKHVKPRASANPNHLAYYYCYDDKDSDVVLVFQLYKDAASSQDFMKGDWYSDYVKEVGQFVAKPPVISSATPIWAKGIK
jgi:quinol monooxygenase YgiN